MSAVYQTILKPSFAAFFSQQPAGPNMDSTPKPAPYQPQP